jgi:diguanylate cyclase (GGDEF)-like protein
MIVKARVNTHIKLYQYRKQVEYQSMTDQLTGIANRRRYERVSEQKWQEAIRLRVPFSICMMDIDHFKKYNDTFGHPAGDTVITAVSATAGRYLRRNTDFLARYGGEEFVVFMMGDSSRQAFEQMCRVRRAVEELHIPHSGSVSEWVTISAGGTTVLPKRGDSFDTFLKIADTMLYDAKRFGRNRVVWNDENMRQFSE